MTATLAPDRQRSLKVCVTSAIDREIWTSALPWGNTYSLNLLAVPAKAVDREHALRRSYPIDDPVLGNTVLRAGTQQCGMVDLTDRFPSLEKVLATDDVLVFWEYGWGADGSVEWRAGGLVEVPRR